jgi:hypothetical protein
MIEQGEKLLIILRRNFEAAPRRHFVGVVGSRTGDSFRATGYLFIFDMADWVFVKKPGARTRIFRIDNDVKITVLPKECDVKALSYRTTETGTVLTDGSAFSLDVSEFTARR